MHWLLRLILTFHCTSKGVHFIYFTMRQIFFYFLFLSLILFACQHPASSPTISLLQPTLSIEVPKGKTYTVSSEIKNDGDDLLFIKNISADCSCTTIQYDTTGIAPGAISLIKITYDSQFDKPGPAIKKVMVHSNTSPQLHPITINVNVLDSL